MAAVRLCCWPLLLLVLVFMVALGPRSAQAAPGNKSSLDSCGKEPGRFVGLLDSECTCEVGCDAGQNLWCVHGRCRCQPDTVIINQTCLLKSHYNESCEGDRQCQDPHQLCDPTTSRCRCQPGFNQTADRQSPRTKICRPGDGHGRLGDHCSTVADCNWRLEHVHCSSDDRVCRCDLYYSGQTGGLECREQYRVPETAWLITVWIIAAILIAIAASMLLCCAIRECSRSHTRSRGRVIAAAGPVSDQDRPPPYVAVIDTKRPPNLAVIDSKPPAYTATSDTEKNCMDNYGFTPCELEPYSAKKP